MSPTAGTLSFAPGQVSRTDSGDHTGQCEWWLSSRLLRQPERSQPGDDWESVRRGVIVDSQEDAGLCGNPAEKKKRGYRRGHERPGQPGRGQPGMLAVFMWPHALPMNWLVFVVIRQPAG